MKNQGFILVYTVLILSLMLITGGIFADTVLKEVSISRDEAESLKAFYAADAGVECVRYFHNQFDAFNTAAPQRTPINCGFGVIATVPNNMTPTAECEAVTYTLNLTGFTNGACAVITVNMVPKQVTIQGNPVTICDAEVIADGRNRCGAGASKVVERTRWENM